MELASAGAAATGGLTTTGDVLISGVLKKMKQGKKWKQRWCAILDGADGPRLLYRESEKAKKAKGILALRGAWVTVDANAATFQIQMAAGINSRGKAKLFSFEAESEAEREPWLDAFRGLSMNMPLDDDALVGLSFDTLACDQDELEMTLVEMAVNLRIPELLGKEPAELRKYFAAVRGQMRECPFHNWQHVVDVSQMMYTLLRTSGLAVLLSPLQLVAVFLAAPAHDLDHRGRSNALELSEQTDIAVRYPDAPLETHHATLAQQTLDDVGLLDALAAESQSVVKECVRRCIMATDMGHHKEIMEEFQESETELLSERHTAADFFTHGPKGMLLLGMLLKACDISNPARPIEIADKWNEMVYEEFYAEGDADAAAGREVNPMHNRESNNVASSTVREQRAPSLPADLSSKHSRRVQVGFIKFVVAGVFDELQKFCAAAAEGKDAPGIRAEAVADVVMALELNEGVHAARP